MAKALRNFWALSGIAAACLVAASFGACSAGTGDDIAEDDGAGPGTGGQGGAGASGSTTSGVGGLSVGNGGSMTACNQTAETDLDGDGFKGDVDCDDCNALVNPEAVEVIAEPTDEDPSPTPGDENCDGQIDVLPPPCDSGLAIDDSDPMNAAKAIEVCDWVVKVEWVMADGQPPPIDPTAQANFHLGHGILPDLGPNVVPQRGDRMLMLSSGTARRETDPGFVHRNFEKTYGCNPPFGFPKESPSCPNVTTGPCYDSTGIEIEIKAPTNAKGFSFDFNFFTYEWPKFICKEFNDFFVANLVLAGNKFPENQTDGNISFDAMQNPISVNNAFLDVCDCPGDPPCQVPPGGMSLKSFDCALGATGVQGTDFDVDDGNPGWTNGSTGWLRTEAPVEPGKTFKLRLVVYDSGDGKVDSATLVDNFTWKAEATVGTDVIR